MTSAGDVLKTLVWDVLHRGVLQYGAILGLPHDVTLGHPQDIIFQRPEDVGRGRLDEVGRGTSHVFISFITRSIVRTELDAFHFDIFVILQFIVMKYNFVTTFTNSYYNMNEAF